MSEDKSAQRLLEHEELRDIHTRIDGLKTETERNHRELTSKLHDLEVAVARGGRFPAAAYVAAAALAITVVAHGAVIYAELQTAKTQATTSIELMGEHVKGLGNRQAQWSVMDERMKQIESKIVGRSEAGWHRADHDQYARTVEAQHEAFDLRLKTLEHGHAELCQRMQACKGVNR